MNSSKIETSILETKKNYRIHNHDLGSLFAQFQNNTVDVLISIEMNVKNFFFKINESEPINKTTRVDLISIHEFMRDWVNKPEFKAFAFQSEIENNCSKLKQLIENSRETSAKNKPEIEKIKLVENNYEKIKLFSAEIKKELAEIEKSFDLDNNWPDFENVFQRAIKYLSKVSKIMSRLAKFEFLYSIDGSNIDQWIEDGYICTGKFRNISDATTQLIENFYDLEKDIEHVEKIDYKINEKLNVN